MEDRISSLTDDLIRHILSFVNTRKAVQTSVLSTRWRQMWKSVPHLNFTFCYYNDEAKFSKFLNRILSHRNHNSHVSAITYCEFLYDVHREQTWPQFLERMVRYANSHNPQSLKHLTLRNICGVWSLPQPSRNFPALTTLYLVEVLFERIPCPSGSSHSKSVDLFSDFVNLKNLTLINCSTKGIMIFNIVASRLETLIITDFSNNPTQTNFVVSAPNLSSFEYKGFVPLLLSMNDPYGLEKVSISISGDVKRLEKGQWVVGEKIVNMFYQLRNAHTLVLGSGTVTALSKGLRNALIPGMYPVTALFHGLHLQEPQPSPFCNLRRLKLGYRFHDETPDPNVISYFLTSSPSVNVAMKLDPNWP